MSPERERFAAAARRFGRDLLDALWVPRVVEWLTRRLPR